MLGMPATAGSAAGSGARAGARPSGNSADSTSLASSSRMPPPSESAVCCLYRQHEHTLCIHQARPGVRVNCEVTLLELGVVPAPPECVTLWIAMHCLLAPSKDPQLQYISRPAPILPLPDLSRC